ncbi:MAG: hypothetical protein KBG64_05180 [Clostridia bacterium]|nr:hypothetical protein [Clostridia bacterium]
MYRLTRQNINELLRIRQNPCISIYLPVEKVGQDTRQGPIRLRKLLKATAEGLRERAFRTPDIEKILAPAEALLDDALFWEHQYQGLALYLNFDGMMMHQFIEPCAESVTISDRFMIVPILAEEAHDRVYYLLALSLENTRFYMGTHYTLEEIELPEPRSVKEVFAAYDVEKQLRRHSAPGPVFHGFESMKDSEKQRIEEFFRRLSDNLKKVMSGSDAPLVVACVEYLFPIFRSAFKDSRLMDEMISGSPEAIKRDVLRENAWKIARKAFEKDKENALETFQKLGGTERIRSDIGALLPLAFEARVDTLFIRRDSQVWGVWDPQTGEVISLLDHPLRFGDPDMLGEAAARTLEYNGRVFVLEEEEMPVHKECAGILRF